MKPKRRSKIRIFFGKRYYTAKRYIHWITNSNKYALTREELKLKNTIFQHRTPLRRHLRGVDKSLDDNKVVNITIALSSLNQVIIKPGEVFSYWRLIGRPKKSKGYIEGMVLDHGKYKKGIGGGLCQLSNMIFWMILHTPLEVIERHRHSYDIFPDSKRTLPFGSGATCVYNYRDLQIFNPTNEVYQMNFRMDDNYLYGEIVSNVKKYLTFDVYEAQHYISHEYWGGYIRHNEIKRKVCNLYGEELDDQAVCENHAIMMYSPLLSKPKGFCD